MGTAANLALLPVGYWEGVNPNVCGALEGTGNKASKVSGEEFIAVVIL